MSAPTLIKIQPPGSGPVEPGKRHIFDALREAQGDGYLSQDKLKELADPPLDAPADSSVPAPPRVRWHHLHAVASYFPHFRLKPRAKVEVRVCDDMSCHLRGAHKLRHALEKGFPNVEKKDLDIDSISCLGRCDHAPALVINDRYYDDVSEKQAITLVETARSGGLMPPEPSCDVEKKHLDIDPYDGRTSFRYDALRKFARTGDWGNLLAELKASRLQGMGGAGFLTSTKWEIVKNAVSRDKYVVCNADESEPGTIKDRFILTRVPHLVVEGMILAGLFTGATRGYLYLRHEYKQQQELLEKELAFCRQEGLIGQNILGTGRSFNLELFISPGGYICGEESALLEAIEGKRAEPRNKPPFVATVGLWGKPTVVNNVETLAFAAAIAAKGGCWFNSYGVNAIKNIYARGLKFVGVSGDVREPGVFEVPMGATSYRELIYEYAGGLPEGRDLVAFAPSGPSSGYLPAKMVDLPLDWNTLKDEKSMVGSGAIVVCATGTCMLDMALNAVRFYRNESCGKCVPCRLGSQQMVEILRRWTRGEHDTTDCKTVESLCDTLRNTSICGLGQIVPAPIESVLRHFRSEVKEHFHRRCPAGVCFKEGAA